MRCWSILDPTLDSRSASTGAGSSKDAALTYYSYITLTTVGYGDVTPASPGARTLSMLEGLVGQLYVAIIIARIVAQQITHSDKTD